MKGLSEKEMESWVKVRTGGKWLFVAKIAIKFWLLMTLSKPLIDWFFGDQVRLSLATVVFYAVFSVVIGLVLWWQSDATYQNQILGDKVQKGLEGIN